MGWAAAEQTAASVRPEHIQESPAAAAPSHSPPALFPPLETFVPRRDHFLGRGDDGWYFISHFGAVLFYGV